MNTEDLIEHHIQSLDAYNKGRRSLSREEIGEALFHFERALDIFPDRMLVEPQLDRQTRLSMQQLKANILSHIELVRETYPGVAPKSPEGWVAPEPPSAPLPETFSPAEVFEEELPVEEEAPGVDLFAEEESFIEEPAAVDYLPEPAAETEALLDEVAEADEDIGALLASAEPPPLQEPVLEGDESGLSDESLTEIEEPPAIEIPLPEPVPAQIREDDSLDALLDTIGPAVPLEDEPPAVPLPLAPEPPPPQTPPAPVAEDEPPAIPLPSVASEPSLPEPAMEELDLPDMASTMPDLDHLLSDIDPPSAGAAPQATPVIPLNSPAPVAGGAGANDLPPIPVPPSPVASPGAKRKRKILKRRQASRQWQWLVAVFAMVAMVALVYANWGNLTLDREIKAFEQTGTFQEKVLRLNALYAKAHQIENNNWFLKVFAPAKHRQVVADTFMMLDHHALEYAQESPRHAREFLEKVDGRYWSEGLIRDFLNQLAEQAKAGKPALGQTQKILGKKLLTLHCDKAPDQCRELAPLLDFAPPASPESKALSASTPLSASASLSQSAASAAAAPQKHQTPKAKPAATFPLPVAKAKPTPFPPPAAKKPVNPIPPTHALVGFPSKSAALRAALGKAGIKPRLVDFPGKGEKLVLAHASVYAGKPDLKRQMDDEFMKVMDTVMQALGPQGGQQLYEVHYRVLSGAGKPVKTWKVLYQPYQVWVKEGKQPGRLQQGVITVVR